MLSGEFFERQPLRLDGYAWMAVKAQGFKCFCCTRQPKGCAAALTSET